MRLTLTITQMLVRITGVLQLILGLVIWTENASTFIISIHTYLGILLVLSLWALAAVSTREGVPMGLAVGVAVLGLIAVVFGMAQASLMRNNGPGLTPVIQVLHLLIGMATVASGEIIGGRVRRMRLAAVHP